MSNGFDEVFSAVSQPDELLEHYQLSHDPFAARAPGFKFFTPKRKPVLAELHHLARYGHKVLVVAGPQGAGKTLLRQALVASSNKDVVQCVVLSAREHASEAALLAQLCQALNTEQRDVASLLQKAQQSELVGIQLYLVIDDAELLESSAISMLCEIAEAGSFAPRVFLFADSESVGRFASAAAGEEAGNVHVVSLAALDVNETRDYLAQRLEGAGQGIELLSDEQIEEIHRLSGGWPGGINLAGRQVMLRAMQQAPLAARTSSSGGIPFKALAALGLIGLGVAVAWYMGDRAPVEPERTVLQLPEPVVEAQIEVPEPIAPPAPASAAAQNDGGNQTAPSAAGLVDAPVLVEGDETVPARAPEL
ncbi:MAG TPA: cell division protein, partial [Pseudomonas sp.]|nr:cell division protein [Pseudomonas sp.]